MENEIKLGSVVSLKSSKEPFMTVSSVVDKRITCTYFDRSAQIFREFTTWEECLTVAKIGTIGII